MASTSGPSAHSFNGSSRQWNVSNNPIYIDALKHNTEFSETETLSKLNRYNEYILTRLRTKWGCDLNYIKKEFGNNFAEHFEETSAQFLLNDLQQNDSNYSLTKMGKLMADKIAMELFM